ncbi:hypothetical protein ACOMHN_001422 [Nucella lapillus]
MYGRRTHSRRSVVTQVVTSRHAVLTLFHMCVIVTSVGVIVALYSGAVPTAIITRRLSAAHVFLLSASKSYHQAVTGEKMRETCRELTSRAHRLT